ncbi:MAG: hypothetical protein J7539_15555, partial [Niabella sp.]|nr:hypothetical protein [Niabella sp.]
FKALGYTAAFYDPASNHFRGEAIVKYMRSVEAQWKDRYPKMSLKTEMLDFSSLLAFNVSFTTIIEIVNMDVPA